MRAITKEGEFNEVIAQGKPTVVLFKTTWCPDCHYLDPFIDDVVKKYENDLTFVQVDRDELPDLCQQYNILGIPSFIVFKQGKELVRFVSKLRKTRGEIEEFLDRGVQVAQAL